MKIEFSFRFFILFISVFILEVIIATFINDSFIRPFVGDVLVIILIYSFIRMILRTKHLNVAFGVFIFACFVEFSQYFNLVSRMNLESSRLAKIIIGTIYSPMDFVAYAIGTAILFIPFVVRKYYK